MAKKRRPSAYAPRRSSSGMGLWVGVAVVAVLAFLVVLKVAAPQGSPALDGQPVAASVLQNLTSVQPKTFALAESTTAQSGPYGGSKTLWTSGGKPVFFYFGYEYCPYCAASRWSMVTALARFGTWSGLEYMTSSSTDVYPTTHTLTFLNATYTSKYITFESVENMGNTPGPTGQYPTLQIPTTTQQTALTTYDATPYVPANAAGSVPFMDVGNRYLWVGSLLDPGYLAGMDWLAISKDVHAGTKPAGTSILAGANALSAAICAVDGDHPSSVCNSTPVAVLIKALPAATPTPAKTGTTSSTGSSTTATTSSTTSSGSATTAG